jgi:hypothetical protein
MTILPGAVIVCPVGRFPFLDPNDYPPGIVRHRVLSQEGGDGAHGLVGQRRRFSHEAIPLLPTHPQSPIPFSFQIFVTDPINPHRSRTHRLFDTPIHSLSKYQISCPLLMFPSTSTGVVSSRANSTHAGICSALLFAPTPTPVSSYDRKMANKAGRMHFQPLRHVENITAKPVQRLRNNGLVCLGMACWSAEKVFGTAFHTRPSPVG